MWKFLLLLVVGLWSSMAFSHGEEKPFWQLNADEIQELQEELAEHRREYVSALEEAISIGVLEEEIKRNFAFDSEKQTLEIPRSILNRVIWNSLKLEIAETKAYLFCGKTCSNNLEKDLGESAEKDKFLNLLKELWPKVEHSMEALWKDIPLAFWHRLIRMQAYSRSLAQDAWFHGNSYGVLSMFAGLTGFSVAFGVTEALESLILVGPLHFFCKANYIWSIAFGTAIASFSIKAQAFTSFSKSTWNLWKRFFNLFSGLGRMRDYSQLEKRLLFQVSAENSTSPKVYRKVKRRAAYVKELDPYLGKNTALSAFASDELLWSDLWMSLEMEKQQQGVGKKQNSSRLKIQQEFSNLFSNDPKQSSLHWQDMMASLRVHLKAFRLQLELFSSRDQRMHLNRFRAMGQLQKNLDRLNLLGEQWFYYRSENLHLVKKSQARSRDGERARWLQSMVMEMLSLGLELSSEEPEGSWRERLAKLEESLSSATRAGDLLSYRPTGLGFLKHSLQKEKKWLCRNVIQNE